MTWRFNPAPGWPTPPEGFVPGPGWRPDPSWPPAPAGWQALIDDDPLSPPPSSQAHHPAAPVAPPPSVSPRDTRTTNGLAITSFVLSLLGGTVIPIILGVAALKQIRNRGQKGRNLARAGITIGSLMLVVFIVGIGYVATHRASRDPVSGAVSKAGSVPFHDLRVGDCLVYPDREQFTQVDITPCAEPHTAQVYLTTTLSAGPFPGEDGLRAQIMPLCRQGLESMIDQDLVTDTMEITYFEPSDRGWATGDRVANCLVHESDGTLTSSLLR